MPDAYITDCPKSGAGVHLWIFKAAHELRNQQVPPAEAIRIITANMSRAPGPADEVETAVDKVYSGQTVRNPRWSQFNPELRAAIVQAGPSLAELSEASPVRFDAPAADEVMRQLYQPDDLLCCGWEKNRFDTRPFGDWREFGSMRYVVPSPMRALRGKTQTGKLSAKANSNAGPRRFLVVEYDSGSTDEHSALAFHLAKFAPLVLCVFSGGKSLHSWFNVASWTEEAQTKFFNYAVSTGADRALWTISQFTRMPDGLHASGARQTVHFFDPAKL